ncbi:hypothetical protein BDM02DRAFT_3262935 [Thelephora ganbajun]|uniref:Uncharacterized protein n=1 Tax=Thelephora ganbajun TaxID=370292 RepID=A0ACB6Z7W3_THEGA|nr:hypothetical protein BDM02DRAFT_3262935 [Thelephora ganbajun]
MAMRTAQTSAPTMWTVVQLLPGTEANPQFLVCLRSIFTNIVGSLSPTEEHFPTFFSIKHDNETLPCALVEWYETVGNAPDKAAGMWVIKPEYTADSQRRVAAVVRLPHFRDGVLIHINPPGINRTGTGWEEGFLLAHNRLADGSELMYSYKWALGDPTSANVSRHALATLGISRTEPSTTRSPRISSRVDVPRPHTNGYMVSAHDLNINIRSVGSLKHTWSSKVMTDAISTYVCGSIFLPNIPPLPIATVTWYQTQDPSGKGLRYIYRFFRRSSFQTCGPGADFEHEHQKMTWEANDVHGSFDFVGFTGGVTSYQRVNVTGLV